MEANADLAGYDILVIGKGALTADGPAPDVMRVRDGLRVIVFEQTSEALEKRLGFRATEYGLRQVFKRVPDHPLLAGLDTENLHDWRGEATLLPPRLNYQLGDGYQRTAPTVEWCGIEVHAHLAMRMPRQRGVRPHRETGARRFHADPGRRLQPAI